MNRRRNGDSDFDGDLVDPTLGGAEPPASASPASHPNAHHGPVYVGGGEREARAYVAPTAVPAAAAPKSTADKVAIASSVDPRRMQTMRLPPGRPRPAVSPDEQKERPETMTEEGVAAPSSRYPTSAAQISKRPKSAMASATVVRAPPSVTASSGPPTLVWVLAVALAALIGAGTALWLRKSPAPPAPAPSAPDKPAAPTNR